MKAVSSYFEWILSHISNDHLRRQTALEFPVLPEANMRMARFYYVLVAVEEPIEVAIDIPSGSPP